MKIIDSFLDKTTMYRLVLYILIVYLGIAFLEAIFNLLPFTPLSILESTVVFLGVCYLSSKLLSKLFHAPANVESSYITALILSLIVSPPNNIHGFVVVGLIGLIAISSKYLIAFRYRHLFNPAAFAVVISGLVFSTFASWWVGTASLFPFVLIGGLLLVRKLRYEDLFFSFLGVVTIGTFLFTIFSHGDIFSILKQLMLDSPIIFMGTIMLIEPQTLPPTNKFKNLYGVLVGFFTIPQVHFLNFFLSPEAAILSGNILSFFFNQRSKLVLTLKEKKQVSRDVWEFIFNSSRRINFIPGQYMEWTLSHPNTDSRGNRRYFTIASSPTEEALLLGIKFEKNGSSYKKALGSLSPGSKITAANLDGEFVLPKDKNKKLVFVAGGIGITPFRSMLKYLVDNNEKRDIALLYSNSEESEISFKEFFDSLSIQGIKVVYTLTNKENLPREWKGEVGRIDQNLLTREVPDFNERRFYISGSHLFVEGIRQTLKNAGVSDNRIKKDYFPGYA